MTSLSTDEHGFLIGFPYSDGKLEGVVSNRAAGEMHLALRSSAGQPRVLTMHGVTAFEARELRQGNIVFSIRLLTASEAKSDLAICQELKDRLYKDIETLEPDAIVVELLPSYGADIIAICTGLTVSEEGVTLGVTSAPAT